MRALLVGALAGVLGLATGPAAAQTVSMSGRLGDRALLIIDGKPRTLSVGNTVDGVKLMSVDADASVVEVGGQRVIVRLGGTQVNLGSAASEGGGRRIVLSADSGGHFFTDGAINGKTVRFVVDTGATQVSMSQAEADRIGLKYQNGERGFAQTANGRVPTHRVMLDSVRIGDVRIHNVEALIVPADMRVVLLGNSFLTRFQMKRENDTMTLERRF